MQTWILVPIGWTGCVLLAAWGVGDRLFRRLAGSGPIAGDPALRVPAALLLGLAAFAHWALLLGFLHLLYPAILVAGVLAGAALAVPRALGRARRALAALPRPALSDAPLALAALFALTFLPAALDPRLAHDDNVYHLALPKTYLAGHAIVPLPFSLFANMPHLPEVLYTIPMAAGDYVAAKVFVWAIHLALVGTLAAFAARRLGRPWAGVAALLYLTGKSVQWHMGLAYVEPLIGFFLLCGAIAVAVRRETGDPRATRLAAVACGLAIASKYSAWPFAAVLAVAALLAERRGALRREAVLFAAICGAIAAPWLVKNAVVTGNPIFPNAYRLLGGRHWSAIQEMQLGRSMAAAGGLSETWRDLAAAPWRLAVADFAYYCPSFSIPAMALFLAAVVLPWSYRGAAGFLPVAALAGFLGWLATVQQGRFLTAWTPVIVLAGLAALRPLARARGAAALVAAAVVIAGIWQIRTQKYPYAPSLEVLTRPRAELAAQNPNRELVAIVNGDAPPSGKVLGLWENRLFFLERPYWADSAYEAPSGLTWLREAGDAAAFARALAQAGFTHVLLNTRVSGEYFDDAFEVSMTDAALYPPARLERDRGLFAAFRNGFLEEIGREGDVTAYRLRAPAR